MTSDYFSDFFELDHHRSTSSVHVIRKLKAHFARHGIPEQLVTENGPQFVSRDFLTFSKEWDFDHRTSSPRHSQSNGKTGSAVKKAKTILVKCKKAGSDAFLAPLDHRNTPPTRIQISPAQRLLNRRTRSLLPMSAGLQRPSVADENMTCTKLRLRQQQQARYYNRGARDLDPLEKGDPVRVKPWQFGKKEWQKRVVKKRLDERSYEVELLQGVLRRTGFILGGPTNLLLLQLTLEMRCLTSHSLKVSCLKPMSCRPKLRPKLRLKVPLKFIRPLLSWKHPS